MLRMRTFISLILVAALIATSYWWMQRNKPIAVEIATVSIGAVERTVTNTRAGTLNACRRAKLSPSLGGQIANLPVTEGEKVKKGQLLFEIWNLDLQAQLRLTNAEVLASKALQQQSCIQSDLAEREAQRLSQLRERGLSSDEATEKAISLSHSSKAACEAASATITVSKSRVEVARAALQRTQLLAPFDGTIAEVNGELGEYVTPSPVGIPTPPAVDIIDTQCLYVSAPIDEVDAPQIKAGMQARISLDAFGKKFFDGQVRRVAPYVLDKEKQARTVDIEVVFINALDIHNMLPGYTADVEVIIDTHMNSIQVPTAALFEGNRVYIYDSEFDTISLTPVKTGLSNWQFTEIIEGLEANQKIVTSIDRDGLADGVEVKEEKK